MRREPDRGPDGAPAEDQLVCGGHRVGHVTATSAELFGVTDPEEARLGRMAVEVARELFGLFPGGRVRRDVPLSESPPTMARRYRVRYAADQVESLRRKFPGMAMHVEGEEIVADARIEDHERLAEWLAGDSKAASPPPPAGGGRQVYSLRVQEQPVRALVGALAQRMNWTVEMDDTAIRAAGLSLESRVSFDVKDVSQEELLRAILQPAELDFLLDGNRLRIVPAKK